MKALIPLARSIAFSVMIICSILALAQPRAASGIQNPRQAQTPAQAAVDEWGDDFDADGLDTNKWEHYAFEGGSGGKVEVKDKQLRMRGMGGSRSGVRSRQSFRGDRFYVEATLSKVGVRTPQA